MKPAQMRIVVLVVSALVVLSCIVWAFAVQEIVPDACTYQPSPARAQAFRCP